MKTLVVCACFILSVTTAHAALTDAEAQAISTGQPRDCSLLVDVQKKAACIGFNKALLECLSAGFKPGLTLKACLADKGKIKRR